MNAKKVVNTVFNYLEKNMVPGMNNLQEIAFYTVKEAINDEADNVIEMVKSKPFVRALAAINSEGDVDVEKLANRVRKGIEAKGYLSFDIPMYGPVRFVPGDIDNILMELKEAAHNENYQNIRGTY